jgi:two-component system chemotaxis sensor kinase CheA
LHKDLISMSSNFEDRQIVDVFVAEASEHLARIEPQILAIEASGADIDEDLVNQVFRGVHSMKGAASLLNLDNIVQLSHGLENVLNRFRQRVLQPSSRTTEVMLQAADRLRDLVGDPTSSDPADVSDIVKSLDAICAKKVRAFKRRVLRDRPEKSAAEFQSWYRQPSRQFSIPPTSHQHGNEGGQLGSELIDGPSQNSSICKVFENDDVVDKLPKRILSPPSGGRYGSDCSVRVPVETLDFLMNLAGELVLGRNQLVQFVGRHNETEMEAISSRIDRVTSELQDAIMKTRMQPIGVVFTRFHRLVRDLSLQLGKKCRLVVSGEEVEVDKTIIEAISDPLTHLVRNAVGHGIEPVEERARFGKPEEGEIQLIARRVAGKLEVELRDDGRGIDVEKVKATAIRRGLIGEEEAKTLSDREAILLIFAPSFSTVDNVSAVSGRGVGMDVVRHNIERLGGAVEVDSDSKLGASIRLTLPLTLAIVPSLVVGQGDAKFAIPQINIREILRVDRESRSDRIRKVNHSEVLRLRGELLPLARLNEVLASSKSTEASQEALFLNIVVVEMGGQRYGILVDEMHDVQEIVVKPLGRFIKSSPCFSGASVLGDGKVALILDIPGIASHLKLNASRMLSRQQTPQQVHETQSVVLFEYGVDEWFAVPMALVSRIERIRAEQIENIGGVKLIQYKGGFLPLLCLEKHTTAAPRIETEELHVIVYSIFDLEVGLVAPSTLDALDVDVDIDIATAREPGIMGSFPVENRTVRLVDLYQMARIAFPSESKTGRRKPAAKNPEKAIVLIAEDSHFVREHMSQIVSDIGAQAYPVEDGEQAWDAIISGIVKPSLVLTDIEMPYLDGIQLCRRIKSHKDTRHLPVIAVSAITNEDEIRHAFAAGIDEYLVKPDRELIEKVIKDALIKQMEPSGTAPREQTT